MFTRLFFITALAAFSITLSGCACPLTPSYEGTPYSPQDGEERTAGRGASSEEDGYCAKRLIPDSILY